MVSTKFVISFAGAMIGLFMGVVLFSAIDNTIECPTVEQDPSGYEKCKSAKGIAWNVIGMLPIAGFFILYFSLPKDEQKSNTQIKRKFSIISILSYIGLAKKVND